MKPVDPLVEAAIVLASPLNLYGKPVYRAMWSADRMQWACGWWNDYDKSTGALVRRVFEARQAPRYQMAARWVIERWMPPQFFGTPEMWEAATAEWSAQHGKVLEIGPYPSEGDYVWIWTCENANTREYSDLTPELARYVIHLAMQPMKSPAEMRAEAAMLKANEDMKLFKMVDDIIGDPFPFLGRVTNITPSSLLTKMREERKRGRVV